MLGKTTQVLIDADKFMNILNEAQIEGDEYYKGLGKAKELLSEEVNAILHPKICDCYHTEIRKEPRYNTITGQIDS